MHYAQAMCLYNAAICDFGIPIIRRCSNQSNANVSKQGGRLQMCNWQPVI